MRSCLYLLTAVLALVAIFPAAALAGEPADLAQRVEALEQEVARLKAQSLKIGVVAGNDVLRNLDEWTEYELELRATERTLSAELKELATEGRAIETSLALMAEGPEKTKAEERLDAITNEFVIGKEKIDQLEDKARRRLDDLSEKIEEEAAACARESGFDVVLFDSSLAYLNKDTVRNISRKIADRMNARYAAERADIPGIQPESDGAETEGEDEAVESENDAPDAAESETE